MGFGGISIWQLVIVLAIVVMLFGTKRLRTLGTDLGEAIKGFRKSIGDKESEDDQLETDDANKHGNVIDAKAEELKENSK